MSVSRRRLGALLVTVLATQVVAAQSRPASVQGAVMKAVSNEPIANATVELRALDSGTARFYSSTSDRDGTFAFRNLPSGRYQLTAMRPGYVRGDFGLRGPGGSGVTVTLTAGQRMTGVRLAMRPTGTIAGRVTDPLGDPIGNVHVKALRFGYQEGRIALVDVKSVFTNDLGEYRLGWLPPGLYNVSALHPDALSNPLNLPEVINSSTIAGTVVTNAGGMNGGSFQSSGDPDPAVRSRLGMVAGEDYVPVYYPGTTDQRAASAIEVRSGAEVAGVDLMIAPIRTGILAGSVRPLPSSTGGGPPRVAVQVSRSPSYNFRVTSVLADPSSGTFSIGGLAPGAYAVAFTFGSGDERLSGHTIVDVAEGGSASAQLVLERGTRIPVSVTVEGTAALPPLRVTLRGDPVVPGIADTPSAVQAADGSLALPAVVPGDYLVNVSPLMTLGRATASNPPPAVPGVASPLVTASVAPAVPGVYVKTIRYGGLDAPDGRIRVDGRSPDSVLEIVVGTSPGRVEGLVIDAARRPAVNATVVLVPAAGLRHRVDLYKVTITDGAGRFRVTNVPPDQYIAYAWEDVETGAWLDPQFMRLDEGRGMPVRMGDGAAVTTELVVISAR